MGNLIIEAILIGQAHLQTFPLHLSKYALRENQNMTCFTSGYYEVSEHMQLPKLLCILQLCLEDAPEILAAL